MRIIALMGKYAHIWSDRALLEAKASTCETIACVIRCIGVPLNNGNASTLRIKCREYGITLPANGQSIAGKRTSVNRRRTVEEVMVKGTYASGQLLRRLMLNDLNVKEVCAMLDCGQGPTWRSKRLVLQVDHIDGDRFNNEASNLRFLCPNCHTQTDTYANNKRST